MVIVSNKKTYSIINEAAHRKRARYQNGLESNSYLGENVVSPPTPFLRVYPAARGRGIIKCNRERDYGKNRGIRGPGHFWG